MEISAYVISTMICFKLDKTCHLRFRDIAKRVTPLSKDAPRLSGVLLYFIQFLMSPVTKRKNETNKIISYARLSKDHRES